MYVKMYMYSKNTINHKKMSTKTTIPISEARKRIFDLAKEVQKPGIYYIFTEKGRPKAVLISAEEFESWVETLEVMADFPDLKKDIDDFKKDYKSGRYKTYATLEEILEEEGYIAKDKSKRNHGIPAKNKTKRQKRTGKAS